MKQWVKSALKLLTAAVVSVALLFGMSRITDMVLSRQHQEEARTALDGRLSMEQLEENLAYACTSGTGKLSEEDLSMLERVRHAYLEETRIPCTKCNYCMPCPNGLDIPALFDAYNSVVASTRAVAARKYAQIPVHASSCVNCGACDAHCPQHLPIREDMKLLTDFFE